MKDSAPSVAERGGPAEQRPLPTRLAQSPPDSGSPESLVRILRTWEDGPGAARRTCSDELRERAVRLCRESQPSLTSRRFGWQLGVQARALRSTVAESRPTADSGMIGRPPTCSRRTGGSRRERHAAPGNEILGEWASQPRVYSQRNGDVEQDVGRTDG